MPTYLSPGVYVEEVEAGSRPIEGVGTSVAAFVGMAAKGPFNAPTLVSNWTQFSEAFGDFLPGSYLAHAVYGYFLNGGSNAYIVRIGQDGAADGKPEEVRGRATPRALPAGAQAVIGAYRVQASERAPRNKKLSVEIADPGGENPPEDQFKVIVHLDGKETETFDNVTTKRGDAYHNTYCYIFRLAGGRVTEVIEHCDTALVERVLDPISPAPLRPTPVPEPR